MVPREKEGYHHGMDDDSVRSYPNDTMKLLFERSSCRSFYKRKIPRDPCFLRGVLQFDLVGDAGSFGLFLRVFIDFLNSNIFLKTPRSKPIR